MNDFDNQALTLNGMEIQKSSNDAVVDLFYAAGASRRGDITPYFAKALNQDMDLAVRVALYARDVREGMGERKVFRDIVNAFARMDPINAKRVLSKVPELGRYDDLLAFVDTPLEKEALEIFGQAIMDFDGLAAKWAPREKSTKKEYAVKLRRVMGLNAKDYRRIVVRGTNVVEQNMHGDEWDKINYSHVPSVASARYQRAFGRHDPRGYSEYLSSLEKGEKGVKINADAIFPYTIAYSVFEGNSRAAEQQWKALPDWITNDTSFLPVVDVSGSMMGYGRADTPMNIAVSLGLYCAQRAKGAFKDTFITFSQNPQWQSVEGLSLQQSLKKIRDSKWGYNTNLVKVYELILQVARNNHVPQSDMPEILIVFSDMQFDAGVTGSNQPQVAVEAMYKAYGYEVPKLVYWNLNNYGRNTPVDFDKNGTALVSGFSPSMIKSILALDLESFDPISIVKKAVMKERYNW